MNTSGSGTATRQDQKHRSAGGAITSALSYYPEFDRLPEREIEAIRGDLLFLMGRLRQVNNRSPSFRSIEFSPHMDALIRHVGLV